MENMCISKNFHNIIGVVAREKHRIDAKCVIKKMTNKIRTSWTRSRFYTKCIRHCNCSQISRKKLGGGIKALFCGMAKQQRTGFGIGLFIRTVPGESFYN